jgi:hypothetical protein
MMHVALAFLNEVASADPSRVNPLARTLYPTEVDSLSLLDKVADTLVSCIATTFLLVSEEIRRHHCTVALGRVTHRVVLRWMKRTTPVRERQSGQHDGIPAGPTCPQSRDGAQTRRALAA